MRRHGLTLLEILLALVLLVALGAIVLPSLIEALHERAFESAADVTNEQLMLARAHAQATGEAVEVTYNAGTKQVEARFFTPWLNEGLTARLAPGTSPLAHVPALAAFGELNEESDSGAPPIAEAWATRVLGSGIRLAAKPPTAHAEAGEEPSGGGLAGTWPGGPESPGRPRTFASRSSCPMARLCWASRCGWATMRAAGA
jgi:type II secretory pathway pseudopilin PulG